MLAKAMTLKKTTENAGKSDNRQIFATLLSNKRWKKHPKIKPARRFTTSNSPAANMRGKPFRKRKHLCGRQRFKKNTAVGGRVQFFVLCGVQY